MRRRRLLWVGGVMAALAIVFVALANTVLLVRARGRVHAVATCPSRPVALVLGCSPISGRWPNPHFLGRVDAAAALWRAGAVGHIIVSGDNPRAEYDEPTAMRDALAARGVPRAAVTCDFAGRRTLDSVARAKLVFGLDAIVVVTQRYHAARTLALADGWGLDAVVCATDDMPLRYRLKTELREVLARAWTVVDLACGTGPRFPGPPEPLPIASR